MNDVIHRRRLAGAPRAGFTLLELIIATTLTLLLIGMVVQAFAFVSDGVFNSRANMDLSDQLRNAKHRLIMDLRGTTAPTIPPLDPSADYGYFEYAEGANVANTVGGDTGTIVNSTNLTKNTVMGDLDDILMFTTASYDEGFIGKAGSLAGKTRYAEVAWFLRQATGINGVTGGSINLGYYNLHRRIWLVNPNSLWSSSYAGADQSMRQELGLYESQASPLAINGIKTVSPQVNANSLGDLTMRERRSIHQPYVWPYDMMYVVGNTVIHRPSAWPGAAPVLSLPTLNNQSHGNFPNPVAEKSSSTPGGGTKLNQSWRITTTVGDAESSPSPYLTFNLAGGGREPEDIILSNVVSFDVKAWDPGAPVFRATPTTAPNTDPNATVVGLIVPGDGGYGGDGVSPRPLGALQKFISSPTAYPPVGFGAYADLNYMWLNNAGPVVNQARRIAYEKALAKIEKSGANQPKLPRAAFGFGTPNNPLSGYSPVGVQYPAVYDTWSRHYEYDGVDNDGDGRIDEGTDGIDNNGNGFIDEENVDGVDPTTGAQNGVPGVDLNADGIDDDIGEREAPPPFAAPLRGIKITIRVMEQDSRQVREVTILHEFLPL